MGKTKNSRRMAAKGGKAARGMVVLPIASSSKTASEPKASTTSNAVLPALIHDTDSTQDEAFERDHSTTAESRPRTKLISKEQKAFLNQIQFAVYTSSTNLHDFFNTIEDEHLPVAIEEIEFLHGREVEEQLNRNQSRLPEDPLFSLSPAPHDPEDLEATRAHLVDLALRIRQLEQINQESVETASFASSSSSPGPANRPRGALDERTGELTSYTSYICDVCKTYFSIVNFTCVKKGCKTCRMREESEKWGRRRNVWCSKECWEIRPLGADDWGECEVRAELIGHVGVEEEGEGGDGGSGSKGSEGMEGGGKGKGRWKGKGKARVDEGGEGS